MQWKFHIKIGERTKITRLLMVFRACLVMAQLLEDSSFCEEFIQQCPAAVEVLNLVAQECSPGEHTVHTAMSEHLSTRSVLLTI